MFAKIIKDRWQQYCEANRCSNLREELRLLLYGKGKEEELAEILVGAEKYAHPGQSESWYLEQVIFSLRKKKFTAY